MRDHVSEEMISAYIDGELSVDERELVERALAESVEHRQLLEELQSLRSSFGELPKYQLSAGFHQRVLDEIQRAQSPQPAHQTAPAAKRTKSLWWRSALGVAAVAAAIVIAVALGPRPEIPGFKQQKDAPFKPDPSWYDEQFVYYLPRTQRAPTHTMVIDLVITKEGQANRVFEEVFRRIGVPLDPAMALDEDLEDALLGSRIIGNVQASDQDDNRDEVELVYVVCDSTKTGRIIEDFQDLSISGGGEVAYCHLDLIFNSKELEMMYQLNHSSMSQFAGPDSSKEKRSLVHRLVLNVKLRSISIPKFATIPTPRISVGAGIPATPHMVQLEQSPSEVLFVVRNLKEPAGQ